MMTLPNILTISRIALIPIFVILYYLQQNAAGTNDFSWFNVLLLVIFFAGGITDFFDGHLARRMRLTSKAGAFLDPVADKLMVATALVLLTDHHDFWLITLAAAIIIGREILISSVRGKIPTETAVGQIGKAKTFVQFLAILLLLYQQNFYAETIFYLGISMLVLATILTVASAMIYLRAWSLK